MKLVDVRSSGVGAGVASAAIFRISHAMLRANVRSVCMPSAWGLPFISNTFIVGWIYRFVTKVVEGRTRPL